MLKISHRFLAIPRRFVKIIGEYSTFSINRFAISDITFSHFMKLIDISVTFMIGQHMKHNQMDLNTQVQTVL